MSIGTRPSFEAAAKFNRLPSPLNRSADCEISGDPRNLVSEIIPQCKPSINRGLRKGRGYGKLRERVVVEEQGVQLLGQGVVGGELDG